VLFPVQKKNYQKLVIFNEINSISHSFTDIRKKLYSPFCVQAKIIKLVGLKNGGRLSPINLVTFAGTQNGEY
jgi:hypothetical protein